VKKRVCRGRRDCKNKRGTWTNNQLLRKKSGCRFCKAEETGDIAINHHKPEGLKTETNSSGNRGEKEKKKEGEKNKARGGGGGGKSVQGLYEKLEKVGVSSEGGKRKLTTQRDMAIWNKSEKTAHKVQEGIFLEKRKTEVGKETGGRNSKQWHYIFQII